MIALPPYAAFLGAHLEQDDTGAPLLVLPFGEPVLGRPGFLHGGAIAGLLEVAAIASLSYVLDARGGGTVTPVTVTVDYQRGGRDHVTYATGIITRLGNRIANVEAVAWQNDRAKPIATARLNYLVERRAI